jgi:hypothetical protein
VAEELADAGGGPGAGEQVALGVVAAELVELASWPGVSTPSAMTVRPRAWPRPKTAATMASSEGSRSRRAAKERSILREDSRRYWREARDVEPVPKSCPHQ